MVMFMLKNDINVILFFDIYGENYIDFFKGIEKFVI